ncbi:MAG: DUF4437 domain-containing protein [Pseudomonadota bacterium]
MSGILQCICTLFVASITSVFAYADSTTQVIPRSAVQFEPLNPARGDASPQAGVLWGDIEQNMPSGSLIVFADGFTSPLHIHNVTYRAVVINGAVHNDDPDAEFLWMGPASFWTQSAGEPHITAAKAGSRATAFLEIFQGPYLVKPTDKAFDYGERPVNLDARNIVWLGSNDITWITESVATKNGSRVEIAFLRGSPAADQRNGSLIKLPAGMKGTLRGTDAWLRAVVIRGELEYGTSDASTKTRLPTGSYFGANDGDAQRIACIADDNCVIYISTIGDYELTTM